MNVIELLRNEAPTMILLLLISFVAGFVTGRLTNYGEKA